MFCKLSSVFLVSLCVATLYREANAGNNRPYGVSLYGSEGAGSVGQDASANGYAGSSLVAPLAAEGISSPNQRYPPNNAFPGNPTGIGFGGFGWRSPSSSSSSGY